ncbi:site-2 protease family protein [Cyanobium sp. NIES-981]|uniref:site-2 protease family protein n=1 Tax=Cyanobium sp. NIES-981 TaxID=1851505 RepID=UPI0007DDEBB5|nr:site-2 protease family protein [Cyanobium sp. NIES-981]SBO42566.1 Peptidase M50 [Cyanobium sp. NIES-981]
MGEGWQLMKIRGIPLRIHPSWFVILLVATAAFQQLYTNTPALKGGAVGEAGLWALGLGTAVLLFVSVLLHELGHSLVAISQGVKVRSITLFLLGGVASVERECSTAIGALLVAAAGPAVSLGLGISLLASSHAASHLAPWLGVMVAELGTLNMVLALFNLLPGLPLDGGLIVKALVWQASGSRRRGIEVANGCGRFLAYLAMGLGTVLLLRGGGIGGAWLILLGWFGLGAVRNQQQMLVLQNALNTLQVKDAARRRFRVLEADRTLRDVSRLRLAEPSPVGEADWLLVCERGRWRGVIDDAALQEIPVQRWDTDRIADHLKPLASLPSIPEAAPLWQAVQLLDTDQTSRLLVMGPAGLPSGTLERPDLGEAVLQKLGLKLPAPLLEAARRQNIYPLGLALPQVVRSMVASGETSSAPEPGS